MLLSEEVTADIPVSSEVLARQLVELLILPNKLVTFLLSW